MTDYTPPEVWTPPQEPSSSVASLNRPVAGSTHEKELPVGQNPLQLYSQATPNGVKATLMLEELLAAGHGGAEYDAWLIEIAKGDQFGSGFVALNPNSKIPALQDRSGPQPVRGHRQLGGWPACGVRLSQVAGRDDNARRSQLRRLPLPG